MSTLFYINFNFWFYFLTGLRHLCQKLTDCEDGMVCKPENATKPAAFGQRVATASINICLCDEEVGWFEDARGFHCSGSTRDTGSILHLVAALISLVVLSKQY